MTNEIQSQETTNGQASLPALAPVRFTTRAKYFGMGMVPMTALLTYMTQGQIGESAVLGAIAGTTLAYFAPEIQGVIAPGLRTAEQVWAYVNRNHTGKTTHRLFDKDWWLTGEQRIPYAE